MRSNDKQLLKELATFLVVERNTSDIGGLPPDGLHYPMQWESKDFENIAKEWDKLFIRKGWIQNA